ncbi:MAG: ABC transporter permease [Clostridia bacterium]|nr:ABC transporter permease [Clostridia bacterium]
MKKNYFRGCGKVFNFTLSRSLGTKSYIALTLILAILLFGTVFAVTLVPQLPDSTTPAPDGAQNTLTPLSRVIVCDSTVDNGSVSWLYSIADGVTVSAAPSLEAADTLADAYTLIVAVSADEAGYAINVLTTDDSLLTPYDRTVYADLVGEAFRGELLRRAGVDASLLEDNTTVTPSVVGGSDESISADGADEDAFSGLRELVAMVVSFLVIFVMYFMILFYGQSAANSVMMEKTSKLMDFFLVSVNPGAMILGKVLASALAAIIQVSVWLLSAAGGWWGGRLAVKLLVPNAADSDFSAMLALLEGLFTPGGIIIAILTIVAGFLLYCSLASIGGALASKPEDLSSTNGIFAMVLVASFLLSLYAGSTSEMGMISSASWLIYLPFTAILVTPGRALSGSITLLEGGISVALILLFAFIVMFIAGKIYSLMSFYRGNPPKLTSLPAMIKNGIRSKNGK